MTTDAPRRANAEAVASPIPLDPPVTTTTGSEGIWGMAGSFDAVRRGPAAEPAGALPPLRERYQRLSGWVRGADGRTHPEACRVLSASAHHPPDQAVGTRWITKWSCAVSQTAPSVMAMLPLPLAGPRTRTTWFVPGSTAVASSRPVRIHTASSETAMSPPGM